jgi:hypothetical protein
LANLPSSPLPSSRRGSSLIVGSICGAGRIRVNRNLVMHNQTNGAPLEPRKLVAAAGRT